MCSPSAIMVPSPFEWKYFEWEEETPSKETNIQTSWLVLFFFGLAGRNIFSLIVSSNELCLSAPSSSVFLSLVSYQLIKCKIWNSSHLRHYVFMRWINEKMKHLTVIRLYTLIRINTTVLVSHFLCIIIKPSKSTQLQNAKFWGIMVNTIILPTKISNKKNYSN